VLRVSYMTARSCHRTATTEYGDYDVDRVAGGKDWHSRGAHRDREAPNARNNVVRTVS
jgi:hypothetical protein